MLDYEWGNPSTMMLSGEEPEPADGPNQSRQFFDHYAASQTTFIDHNSTLVHHQQTPAGFSHNFDHLHQAHSHMASFYDPRSDPGVSHYAPHPLLPLDPVPGGGGNEFLLVPKNEEVTQPPMDFASRIGLNLGGRTYFSSSEDDFVNRLYRRSRQAEPGSSNSPRCQAEGCNADLTHAKHYHRRHKVCEFHSKASTVIAAGLTQRFCQQCSRFHLLAEFDNGKRSCRKRLADHNRRRRKTQPCHDLSKPHAQNTSSDTVTRADSGTHSSSSVTVAVSPPRISLDCFRQRAYQATASSGSSSSLFFSSG